MDQEASAASPADSFWSTLGDPACFSYQRPGGLLSEWVVDLEHNYLVLAGQAAEGRAYNDVKAEVHAFFHHPGLGEICRIATLRATRHLARSGDVWLDVFQGALVRLLGKVQRAFGRFSLKNTPSSTEPSLLGYQGTKPGRRGFPGWLYGVLFHACTDECRKLERYQKHFAGGSDVVNRAVDRQPGNDLRELAAGLPATIASVGMDEETRHVLLGLLDGKATRHIARERNRSSAWVTRRKRHGLALLRNHFRSMEE